MSTFITSSYLQDASVSHLPFAVGIVLALIAATNAIVGWVRKDNVRVIPGSCLKVRIPKSFESKDLYDQLPILDELNVTDPSDPYKIICFEPSTGKKLGECIACTPDQVRQKVHLARLAQERYSKSPFSLRRAMLKTLLDWIVENQSLICRMVALDTGKTTIDASFGDVLATCEKIRWTIEHGEKVLQSEYREPGLIMAHKIPRVDYVPVGVMGAIVSWNYPFHNVFGPIISALMAGNGIVVKCSEQVAFMTDFLQSVSDSLLDAYNVDRDLVQILNGFADAGQALVETADKITFIGSPNVGKAVMKHASNTLTPVILELGGKDCAIVFDDCDYDQFLKNSQRYAFQNGGQNCAGLERVIIHEKLYDRYLQDMTKIVSSIRLGPPLLEEVDMGAITMANQVKIVSSLVDDAIAKGAIALTGGKKYRHPSYHQGLYFTPTILVNVTPEMRIFHEEVFGPVLLVWKFSDDKEAINLANSTQFGLGSGVFSLDYNRAQRVASQLNVGFTNVNDFGVNYLCQGLPFGGINISGFDRFAGVEGLRGNCHVRAFTTDKYQMLGIRTKLPALLQYPISSLGEKMQEGVVRLLYSVSWSETISALYTVLSISLLGRAKSVEAKKNK